MVKIKHKEHSNSKVGKINWQDSYIQIDIYTFFQLDEDVWSDDNSGAIKW